jgi:hypothetical protein
VLSCIRQKAIPIGVLLRGKLVLPRLVSECVLEFGFKLIAPHCRSLQVLSSCISVLSSWLFGTNLGCRNSDQQSQRLIDNCATQRCCPPCFPPPFFARSIVPCSNSLRYRPIQRHLRRVAIRLDHHAPHRASVAARHYGHGHREAYTDLPDAVRR